VFYDKELLSDQVIISSQPVSFWWFVGELALHQSILNNFSIWTTLEHPCQLSAKHIITHWL